MITAGINNVLRVLGVREVRLSARLRAERSCVPVSLRDHVLCSSVQDLADFRSVTEQRDIATTRSDLDEPVAGLQMAN